MSAGSTQQITGLLCRLQEICSSPTDKRVGQKARKLVANIVKPPEAAQSMEPASAAESLQSGTSHPALHVNHRQHLGSGPTEMSESSAMHLLPVGLPQLSTMFLHRPGGELVFPLMTSTCLHVLHIVSSLMMNCHIISGRNLTSAACIPFQAILQHFNDDRVKGDLSDLLLDPQA